MAIAMLFCKDTFMKLITKCLPGLLLLASLVCSATALRAQDIPATKRLPEGVLAYGSVPSMPGWVEKFRRTSMGQLIADPAMKDFRAQFEALIEDAFSSAEAEGGIPREELMTLFPGELSIAAIRPRGEKIGGALLVEINNRQQTLDKILARVQERLENQFQIDVSTETVQDVDVTIWTFSYEDDDGLTKTQNLVYTVQDNYLVMASSISLIDHILTRWDGTADDSFGSNAVFQEIMSVVGGNENVVAKWYFDPIGLISAGLTASPDTAIYAAIFNGYLPALGLRSFKAMGGAVDSGTDEYDVVSRTMYYARPPISGALKVFEFRQTIQNPPAWVPGDATQYFGFNWNIQGAYNAIEETYDSFVGPGAFEQVVARAMRDGPAASLNLREDVIDVLTGEVHAYTKMKLNDNFGGQPNMDGAVALGASSNEDALKLIDALVANAEAVTETTDDGAKIYQSTDASQPVAIAVKDSMIYFAGNIDQLRSILQPADSPLAESAAYKGTRGPAPDQVSVMIFQNAEQQVESVYNAARDGNYDSFTEGKIDFSLLPPFEEVSKYFRPSMSYFVPVENGALNVQYSTPQPE